jgi:hypothetical protein
MLFRRATALAFVVSAIAACSDDTPPPLGSSDTGIQDGTTSDAPLGDGGPTDGKVDAPFDAGPAVCAQPMTFGTGTPVPNVSTNQTDRMGAITADELTIAWMTTAGSVNYADRAAATDPFGATKTVSVPFALDRVALSADGLTLIGVTTDRSTFAQLKRGSRSATFGGAPDTAPFKFLNMLQGGSEDGSIPDGNGQVFDPVLSADGKVFYFTLLAGVVETIAESTKFGGTTYPAPRTLKGTDFASVNGKVRRPTGLSVDGRTLFFWDESTNKERAAFRESATFPGKTDYASFVDLGAYPGAQPTSNCGRIYFEGNGDLLVADRK